VLSTVRALMVRTVVWVSVEVAGLIIAAAVVPISVPAIIVRI